MRFWLPTLLLAALVAPAARAETTTIPADRDATLIEEADGTLANGAGPDLWVGRTGQPAGSLRRGLLRFDLTALPKGAVVESVRLRLHTTQTHPGPREVRAHRLLGDWGEGGSFATGGGGAPATPGDATWLHRFFDPLDTHPRTPPAAPANPTSAQDRWQSPGGDFAPEPSAARTVSGLGSQVLDGPGLIADVQDWLRTPKKNFGWILIGDESAPNTARRLASRQNLLMDLQPRLEITFSRR